MSRNTYNPSVYTQPIFGAESRVRRGISSQADVLVNQTADGIDLNAIWDEWAEVLALWNDERTSIASLLSYHTTLRGEAVPQTLSQMQFEEASEFGVPMSGRAAATPLELGYGFNDYDLRMSTTWKFLRDADSRQLSANMAEALEADNRLVTGSVLNRLFDPAPGMNDDGRTIYGLYNGTDGIAPPPYMGVEFPETTTHYFTTETPVLDSKDVEDAIRAITAKGYGNSPGAQLVILCHEHEAETISTWRRGEPSREATADELSDNPNAVGPVARYDFVLSKSAPAYLTEETIVGQQAPGSFNGLPVFGSYGEAFVIKSNFIPVGYVGVVATGGPNSEANPIAIRQHPNSGYQGLRVIGGKGPYPLQDSFLQRSFGVGTRRRGAAAAIQVTTASTYVAPTFVV